MLSCSCSIKRILSTIYIEYHQRQGLGPARYSKHSSFKAWLLGVKKKKIAICRRLKFQLRSFTRIETIPYIAKLCVAKVSSGKTIRQAKFQHQKKNSSLSPGEKFCPIKVKSVFNWSKSELKLETLNFTNCDYLIGRNFVRRILRRAELLVGEIFVTFQNNCYFRPTKFRPIKWPRP